MCLPTVNVKLTHVFHLLRNDSFPQAQVASNALCDASVPRFRLLRTFYVFNLLKTNEVKLACCFMAILAKSGHYNTFKLYILLCS